MSRARSAAGYWRKSVAGMLAPCAFALAFALPTPAPAQDGGACDPGDVLVGETETEYICMRSDYVTPRKDLCSVLLLVDADKKAIGALDFAASVETLDAFNALAKEQKADLEGKMLGALLDSGMELSSIAVDKVSTLNPYNVNTAIKRLRETGLEDPAVFGAMRRIAATRGKPSMAKEYADFLEAIGHLQTVQEAADATDHRALRWSLAALKLVQTNPYADLAVTGAEMTENLAYLWYLSGQTDKFTQATEARLLDLGHLTDRLKGHVKVLHVARQKWQAVAGSSDPRCLS